MCQEPIIHHSCNRYRVSAIEYGANGGRYAPRIRILCDHARRSTEATRGEPLPLADSTNRNTHEFPHDGNCHQHSPGPSSRGTTPARRRDAIRSHFLLAYTAGPGSENYDEWQFLSSIGPQPVRTKAAPHGTT